MTCRVESERYPSSSYVGPDTESSAWRRCERCVAPDRHSGGGRTRRDERCRGEERRGLLPVSRRT